MGNATGRILYIGTSHGLYQAEQHGGRYEARRTGEVIPEAMKVRMPEHFGFMRKLLTHSGLFSLDCIKSPVVVDRTDPRRLYVGSEHYGVFRSEDGGRTWRPSSEGLRHPHVWSLAQHPVTGELYAGTEPAAVFKSTDGGLTWKECERIQSLPRIQEWTFPRAPHLSHVKHFAFDPEDPSLVLAAVEEGWLLRSRDGGETWENLTEGLDFDAHSVALMPDDKRVLLATTGQGFYHSTDAGAHFTRVTQGLDRRYLSPLVYHPARPRVLFLAASASAPNKWFGPAANADTAFYRSEDQGQSWRRLEGTPRLEGGSWAAAGDPEDPDCVCIGLNDGTVWMTEDGGGSFREILSGLKVVASLKVVRA